MVSRKGAKTQRKGIEIHFAPGAFAGAKLKLKTGVSRTVYVL
jgi:hypothetical protein